MCNLARKEMWHSKFKSLSAGNACEVENNWILNCEIKRKWRTKFGAKKCDIQKNWNQFWREMRVNLKKNWMLNCEIERKWRKKNWEEKMTIRNRVDKIISLQRMLIGQNKFVREFNREMSVGISHRDNCIRNQNNYQCARVRERQS